MTRTLRICCWLIVTLAAFMTVWMNLHARDSAIHPGLFLPVALLPYVILAFTVRRSRTQATLFCTLAAALITLAVGFWFYYEGLFVDVTTLNASLFVAIPLMQFVPALSGWVAVYWYCRTRKFTDEKSPA